MACDDGIAFAVGFNGVESVEVCVGDFDNDFYFASCTRIWYDHWEIVLLATSAYLFSLVFKDIYELVLDLLCVFNCGNEM